MWFLQQHADLGPCSECSPLQKVLTKYGTGICTHTKHLYLYSQDVPVLLLVMILTQGTGTGTMFKSNQGAHLLIIDLFVHFLMVAFIVSDIILLVIVLVIIDGCQAQSGKSHQRKSGPDDHVGNVQVGPKLKVRF